MIKESIEDVDRKKRVSVEGKNEWTDEPSGAKKRDEQQRGQLLFLEVKVCARGRGWLMDRLFNPDIVL